MQPFASIDELFKGRHFDRQIIFLCVSRYTSFKLSLRDLVSEMANRGIEKRWWRLDRRRGGDAVRNHRTAQLAFLSKLDISTAKDPSTGEGGEHSERGDRLNFALNNGERRFAPELAGSPDSILKVFNSDHKTPNWRGLGC